MAQKQPADVVCIIIPPREQLSKVVRLTTAGVASRTGLTLDEADDLNTALDELFRLYVTDPDASDDLCIRYNIYSDKIEIVAQGIPRNLFDDSNRISRYSRFILERVADQVKGTSNPQGGFEVVLVKNLT